jgi:hypothetical protein
MVSDLELVAKIVSHLTPGSEMIVGGHILYYSVRRSTLYYIGVAQMAASLEMSPLQFSCFWPSVVNMVLNPGDNDFMILSGLKLRKVAGRF